MLDQEIASAIALPPRPGRTADEGRGQRGCRGDLAAVRPAAWAPWSFVGASCAAEPSGISRAHGVRRRADRKASAPSGGRRVAAERCARMPEAAPGCAVRRAPWGAGRAAPRSRGGRAQSLRTGRVTGVRQGRRGRLARRGGPRRLRRRRLRAPAGGTVQRRAPPDAADGVGRRRLGGRLRRRPPRPAGSARRVPCRPGDRPGCRSWCVLLLPTHSPQRPPMSVRSLWRGLGLALCKRAEPARSGEAMRQIPGAWQPHGRQGAGLLAARRWRSRPTIFAEMSAACGAGRARSTSDKGFPDEDGPAAVLDAARAGNRARREPVPAGPRHPGPARSHREHQRRFYGIDGSTRTRDVLVTAGATEALAAALLGLTRRPRRRGASSSSRTTTLTPRPSPLAGCASS